MGKKLLKGASLIWVGVAEESGQLKILFVMVVVRPPRYNIKFILAIY